MRRDRRLFGNNLKVMLSKKGIKEQDFAQKLDCTEYQLYQIMDARLILDSDEENKVAAALGESVENMYIRRSLNEYEMAGCVEYRGSFSNKENEKFILDLFDIYCDVQEAIVKAEVY